VKIAAITEDRVTISRHFGRAPFYLVVTVENGEIVGRDLREKLGHAQFAEVHGATDADAADDPRGHGFGAASHDRHVRMADAIGDCEVLLAGGMGAGAYESMQRAGIRPIVTDVAGIDDAVAAFVAGTLVDHTESLH
jgi:predicted Fe-Mo cluster-binding NifX family protein